MPSPPGLDEKERDDWLRPCEVRASHTRRTVRPRSSFLENAQRISDNALKHTSTSSLVPFSLARRKPAKKQPSRTRAASNWKNGVPRFLRSMETTCRTTVWHFELAFECRCAIVSDFRDFPESETNAVSWTGSATSRCFSASRMTLSVSGLSLRWPNAYGGRYVRASNRKIYA